MNQKLKFLCYTTLFHHFEPSQVIFGLKLTILQITKTPDKIGVHLINVKLSKLLTLFKPNYKFNNL